MRPIDADLLTELIIELQNTTRAGSPEHKLLDRILDAIGITPTLLIPDKAGITRKLDARITHYEDLAKRYPEDEDICRHMIGAFVTCKRFLSDTPPLGMTPLEWADVMLSHSEN